MVNKVFTNTNDLNTVNKISCTRAAVAFKITYFLNHYPEDIQNLFFKYNF